MPIRDSLSQELEALARRDGGDVTGFLMKRGYISTAPGEEARLVGRHEAFELVLAHLSSAATTWSGQDVDPGHVLDLTRKNIQAMKNWTPQKFRRAQEELGLPKPR